MKKILFIAAAAILLAGFVVATLLHKAEQAEQTGQRVDDNRSALSRPHAPVLGPADAKVRIVEFLDPACETCRRFYPFVKEILAAHPDRIRLELRYVPFHDNADYAVALLHAASLQGKHWEALNALLAAQDDWVAHHAVQRERIWPHVEGLGLDLDRLKRDMASADIAGLIAQDLEDARALNVTKTPEFFVNGKPMPSFGYEELQALVNEALAETSR